MVGCGGFVPIFFDVVVAGVEGVFGRIKVMVWERLREVLQEVLEACEVYVLRHLSTEYSV